MRGYSFDIETAGLSGVQDEVIVVGFREEGSEGTVTVFYLDSEQVSSVDGAELVASGEIVLKACETEEELVERVGSFIESTGLCDGKARLYGYNSNTYRGGFDIPFLRTRCSMLDVDWVFAGVQHMDLYSVVETAFNTTQYRIDGLNKRPLQKVAEQLGIKYEGLNKQPLVNAVTEYMPSQSELEQILDSVPEIVASDLSTSDNSLDGAYQSFVPGSHYTVVQDDIDSEQVPVRYQSGDLDSVLQHNIADLEMTEGIRDRAERYLSNSHTIADSSTL